MAMMSDMERAEADVRNFSSFPEVRNVGLRLPTEADLNLISLDAAIDLLKPENRPVLTVGRPLEDVAKWLRGQRDITIEVVPYLGNDGWWILTDGERRVVSQPTL